MQGPPRAVDGVGIPEGLGELGGRHDSTELDRQRREQGALLRRPEHHVPPADPKLERIEQPEPDISAHHPPPSTGARPVSPAGSCSATPGPA